ncbi:MAG: hypothetical protein IJS14_08980 [Lentisphaeria bacterium]|nr:hypothetical protein [Lentisphaeria bacterium]
MYQFLINGEVLSVPNDFTDGNVFDTVTLTTEQPNTFEWLEADPAVTVTVNGIALEAGRCDFTLASISQEETIEVRITGNSGEHVFEINTLNANLPPVTVEGTSLTPGDFFLSFINTRSIVKTDKAGNIIYYRNEDGEDARYGLWDFKTHQIDGKTYYSYHSTWSDPGDFIVFTGHNPGERVLMDENYREVARIRSAATEKNQGDTSLDGHEFLMLGEEHYIVMSYLQVEADNIPDQNQYTGEPIEHADKAILVAPYIQEIDHGEVKFEWLSTEHPELYSMTSTAENAGAADFTNTDPNTYVDYVHLNAIVVDDDGDLVVSCRHLNTMIKIDRNGGTGNLIWALSGVADDFGLTEDQKTSGQHYLHYLGKGYFSAFNNNNDKGTTNLVLYHVNEAATALEDDGFRVWTVPGTTEIVPGLPCPPHETYACGSFQKLGNFGVADWGWNISGNELVTEFQLADPTQITFQLRSGYDPDGAFATYRGVKCLSAAPELEFTQDSASWTAIENSSGYWLSIGHQDTGDAFSIGLYGNACDLYNLPNGEYAARITETDFGVSSAESTLQVEDNLAAKAVVSAQNGRNDLFFAKADGTWTSLYQAKHAGAVNDWEGTGETVSLDGKNRLTDFFRGSADANLLLLTDDANGDALFVDDIYSELPDEVGEVQSRLTKIQAIMAGAGDDVVDMTSQRFEYVGGDMMICGGDGNDTIWANRGGNILFGDAGNDRLVGASGDDAIAGGIGNDSMHGGGGNDVFTFGGNWGADTVRQLADGTVTLWFDSGSEANWNAATLTYADGENSVSVSGVSADKVTLKFGNDGSEEFTLLSGIGAFADFTSQKIFETTGPGILAAK